MINKSVEYQFYPAIWCSYSKVQSRVLYRLKNNLMKNFGLYYKDTENISAALEGTSTIDYNFSIARFKIRNKIFMFNVYNEAEPPAIRNLCGEVIPSRLYESLLFHYWNINAETYRTLPESDKRLTLSHTLLKDWNAFTKLYHEVFHKQLCEYKFICSSGVEQVPEYSNSCKKVGVIK